MIPSATSSPAFSASPVRGRTPTPSTTRSAASMSAIVELDRVRMNRANACGQMEADTVLLVQLLDELAQLRAQHTLER